MLSTFPLAPSGRPIGITLGLVGALWFAENGTGMIGRLTPSGTLTEFSVQAQGSVAGSGPNAIASGSDRALLCTEDGLNTAGAIGHLN
jgi:virginiamycin B lyase